MAGHEGPSPASEPSGEASGNQGVPVVVHASTPIRSRHVCRPMLVEFQPGRRYFLQQGANQFVLPPDTYRVQLYSTYFGNRVGTAELDIDTRRGPVAVYYAAPYTIYSAGKASFEPCGRPGMAALVGIVVAMLVLTGSVVVLAVLVS